MRFSVHWSWLAVASCLLCMGCGVRCDCTEDNMQIEGGHYTLTNHLKRGSMLIYHCPEGYYPYPVLTHLCLLDGTWRPRPVPQRCKIVQCPDPNVLDYGSVSPPQDKYFVNNVTTYECYSGYELRGSNRRVCQPSGKWSGYTPICSHDSGDNCADPGVPAGASRTGSSFSIDDKVKYTCNGKLYLVGSKERVCQESGQWTGMEPECYYRHTYDTALDVSLAFGSALKESLTTPDNTQVGKSIRISKNGTLNIYIAVDISESINETEIKDAKNAITKLITKISSFSVNPNYGVLFFSSEVYEIVNILEYMEGKKKLANIKKDLDEFKVGNRNTAGTDLNLVFKLFEEQMAIIKARVKEEGFKEHRHVIIVFTDGAFNMGGSPTGTVEKIKNMVYMNSTAAPGAQSREDFLDIYIFAIGAEILDDDLQKLTVGTGAKHYYKLRDLKNLQKTFDDIIDESDVTGLCGLHQGYSTSDIDSSRKMYPWWVNIVIQNEGIRRCIGSLVTTKFILTAAHCFIFEDLPEHVTVELDTGKSEVKRVKTFMIHPNYNISAKVKQNVEEFYDYDVALIQLEKDVKITPAVRRICIPGTKETSEALHLLGESTLKQQEDTLLKNHLERLGFLTRIRNSVEAKDVHAKLGSNRDECIQHALTAKGITTNNVKDAVTDNFLCTGGLTPRRDHIACTGDSGGALFKKYEHRMIQVGVVSWGTKNLCTAGGMVESDETSRDFHINLFRVVPFLKSVLGNDQQNDYEPVTFLKD